MGSRKRVVIDTVPAREIKRHGIGCVDEALKAGPVHIIKNDRPRYVVLSEGQYRKLLGEEAKGKDTSLLAPLPEEFDAWVSQTGRSRSRWLKDNPY